MDSPLSVHYQSIYVQFLFYLLTGYSDSSSMFRIYLSLGFLLWVIPSKSSLPKVLHNLWWFQYFTKPMCRKLANSLKMNQPRFEINHKLLYRSKRSKPYWEEIDEQQPVNKTAISANPSQNPLWKQTNSAPPHQCPENSSVQSRYQKSSLDTGP